MLCTQESLSSRWTEEAIKPSRVLSGSIARGPHQPSRHTTTNTATWPTDTPGKPRGCSCESRTDRKRSKLAEARSNAGRPCRRTSAAIRARTRSRCALRIQTSPIAPRRGRGLSTTALRPAAALESAAARRGVFISGGYRTTPIRSAGTRHRHPRRARPQLATRVIHGAEWPARCPLKDVLHVRYRKEARCPRIGCCGLSPRASPTHMQ
jgi:hypothetical protein